jgi:hypothetical protein
VKWWLPGEKNHENFSSGTDFQHAAENSVWYQGTTLDAAEKSLHGEIPAVSA